MRPRIRNNARLSAPNAFKSEFPAALLLAACLVFGGATRSGGLGDVVLQFASVAVIFVAFRRLIATGPISRHRRPLIFIAAIVVLPLLQLIPLPQMLWDLLPGRDVVRETYALIGQPQPLLPLSMTPEATWLAALSVLPPVAIFLSVLSLNFAARRRLIMIIIGASVASVFLGLVQLAQGRDSALRFYEFTNRTEAVGFFANRNHLAALLYVATVFAAAYFAETYLATLQKHPRRLNGRSLGRLIAWLAILAILVGGELTAGSRAGFALCVGALLAVAAIAFRDPRRDMLRSGFSKVLAGAGVLAFFLLLPLGAYRVVDRFAMDPNADARIPFARNTISAAITYMPFGSGLGSFVSVYQLNEKASDVAAVYANHAHNDLLELWLETGVCGLLLLAIFCGWLIKNAASVWANDHGSSYDGRFYPMRRATVLALILLLVHSLVDYPLRTTALMAVAALLSALLIAPAADRKDHRTDGRSMDAQV